ncbi:coilin [Pogoniulus pusillus]|uniref:coilin n=1 Tax=Pogoniulus pusillus TaxID=488313 RepID=UPI0030B95313
MAACGGGGAVRLRLLFDFPPPGSPGCALCWLLLEPAQVRLVTDLISLIRHRFGFSRRARLSLFLDGALLPPTESARLVRDNDSLRVKLEEVVADECEEVDDDFSYTLKEAPKRHRPKPKEEEGISRSEDNRHKKEKKKKKCIPEYSSYQEETSVDIWDSHKRYRKRKRKEEASGRNGLPGGREERSAGHSNKLKKMEREKQLAAKKDHGKQAEAATATVALEQANGKSSTKKPTPQSRRKRAGSSDSSSTSSDSDSSEATTKQKTSPHTAAVAALPKGKSQAAASAGVRTVVSNRVAVKANTDHATKAAGSDSAKQSQAAGSASDSSAEEEKVAAAPGKEKSLPDKVTAVKPRATKAAGAESSSSDSDSSDSDALVIKKPTASAGLSSSLGSCTKQLPATTASSCQAPLASQGRGRGRGAGDGFWRAPRGRGFRGMTWGQGRGRGANPGFFYNYSSEGQKQQGHFSEAATKASVLAQDPVEVPRRDYSVLPLLAAPPQVGERIAFKRLELTENYSPEVSDYKEGKIISWNAEKKQIELEILSSAAGQSAKEPGKFDLVYQSADGAELIEYAVPQDTKITESWDALIEPRLIVEPPVNGSSVANGAV